MKFPVCPREKKIVRGKKGEAYSGSCNEEMASRDRTQEM